MSGRLLLLGFVLLPALGLSQPLPDRYRTLVFDGFVETPDILFSEDVPQPTPGGGFWELITGYPLNADDTETTPVDLYMNIFEPAGDTIEARPAVIICFGGGFLTGNRNYWSIRLLAEELAKSGFVTATIDYRLGFNIFDQDLAQRSVYRAIQDSRAAVKYLRANADSLRIDPSEIYIGGHSAGAFMALHNLYLDKESERPISTFEWMQNGQAIPDLGSLDTTGIVSGISGHANCAFSLAGALGFLSFVEDSFDGRTAMFHSEDDDTVPYDTGEPFGSISGFIIGSDLPTVYGSLPISLRCDTVSLVDTLHSYLTRGHGVHEAPGDTALYEDIIPKIGDWFHAQRLIPEAHPIEGPELVCASDLVQAYTVQTGDAVYYDWFVTGGNLVNECDSCNAVSVMWSDTATVRSISVTPYNAFQARGMTQTLSVNSIISGTNSWIAGSGNWFDNVNWSQGRIPLPCEEVEISNDGNEIVIDIPQGEYVKVNSLSTSGQVRVEIGEGAFFEVAGN